MAVFNDVLKPYIPEASFEKISQWIKAYPLQIRISGARISKLGDYRSPDNKNRFHRISINKNLNKYSFLITFTHEYAHLLCYNKFQNKVNPHGAEWKRTYKKLLFELIECKIFPADIEYELVRILLGTVFASFSSEKGLQNILSSYSPQDNGVILEHLPENSNFRINGTKVFSKGKKIRTRFKCYCLTNRRWYYVNPIVRVIPVND